MTVVLGEQALDVCRAYWNGPRLLELLAEPGGELLITGPSASVRATPSTGSSRPPSTPSYDLVLALSPPAVSWRHANGSEPRRRSQYCEPTTPAPTSGAATWTGRGDASSQPASPRWAGSALRPVPPPIGLFLASAIRYGTGGGQVVYGRAPTSVGCPTSPPSSPDGPTRRVLTLLDEVASPRRASDVASRGVTCHSSPRSWTRSHAGQGSPRTATGAT